MKQETGKHHRLAMTQRVPRTNYIHYFHNIYQHPIRSPDMKRPDTIDSPCSFTNLQLEVRLSASPDSSENQQVYRDFDLR